MEDDAPERLKKARGLSWLHRNSEVKTPSSPAAMGWLGC